MNCEIVCCTWLGSCSSAQSGGRTQIAMLRLSSGSLVRSTTPISPYPIGGRHFKHIQGYGGVFYPYNSLKSADAMARHSPGASRLSSSKKFSVILISVLSPLLLPVTIIRKCSPSGYMLNESNGES